VNSDLSDIANALTQSLSADGQTPLTGPIKFPSGSSGTPGVSFGADTTTGMYYPGANQVGFAAGGLGAVIYNTAKLGAGQNGALITWFNGAVVNPVGMVSDFAGATAPVGWQLCYGQAISRTTYAELFFVIGTSYGAGDGSTTFNLPDLRGTAAAGLDNMGGSAAGRLTSGTSLGVFLGEQTHTLITGEMPSHNHSGTTGGQSADHTHTQIASTSTGSYSAGGSNGPLGSGSQTGGTSNDHTHNFTTSSIGGGGAHNNVQPTMVMNKIIFSGRP
jgi:microcystin-dependent protein